MPMWMWIFCARSWRRRVVLNSSRDKNNGLACQRDSVPVQQTARAFSWDIQRVWIRLSAHPHRIRFAYPPAGTDVALGPSEWSARNVAEAHRVADGLGRNRPYRRGASASMRPATVSTTAASGLATDLWYRCTSMFHRERPEKEGVSVGLDQRLL